MLADGKYAYIKRIQIYTGKNSCLSQNELGLSSQVVLDLINGLENRFHKLYVDNYYTFPISLSNYFKSIYVTGSDKTGHFTQTQKIEFFMLIKSCNLSQISAKILGGKTFDAQRHWQLNWAVFSKAIELEIEKT